MRDFSSISIASSAAIPLVLLAVACSNPNDLFSGLWEPVSYNATSTIIDGVPTLALGQYGREVAGVVYFKVPGGSQFRQPCACAYVDHLRYVGDDATLDFETRCEGHSVATLWGLELLDSPATAEVTLIARFKRADAQSDLEEITFRRVQSFVDDAQTRCPPN